MAEQRSKGWAIWIPIGLVIGAAIGAATDRYGLWMPIGAGIGLALGLALSTRR